MSMDEVSPGLWIGDLASALDVEKLKTHRIFSILTAMRGRITINEVYHRFVSFEWKRFILNHVDIHTTPDSSRRY